MGDMFDEDLIRELGLDPAELQPADSKPAVQPQKVAKPETKGTAASSRAAAPATANPENKVAAPAKTVEAKVPEQSMEDYGNVLSQDIPVQLAAVVAKKSLKVRDILDMQLGEIIDFKKSTQEPIDLVANGKLIAKAELVVIEGRLGARIVKLVK